MNSEELEASLRTEFESYLKGVFAELRQEISQLQEKLDAELERHKSELDGVFSNVLNTVETARELDASFRDTVIEHLRLAKDEGATITATAIAQAEEMEKDSAPSTGMKEIHEAVSDISSKHSQSEILKSLVQHAGQFAPRGAFFIIKNEHLVGWRVFGSENVLTDEKLREVFLPLTSDSILSESVKSLETVKGSVDSYNDNAEIFNRLEFSESQQMTAIPLVARGRGVAVLYADSGTEGATVNTEALETLVRVAGLTVEVLASSRSSVSARKEPAKKTFVSAEEYSSPVADTEQVQSEDEESSIETSDYSAPVGEPEQAQEAEDSYASSFEPQPFYDPAPSIAPSVQEDQIKEDVTEELSTQTFVSDAYQTENYQDEEVSRTDIAEIEEPKSETEEIQDEQTVQQEDEKYPAYNQSAWSQSVETQNYSAQEYAENFAKKTDPTEYTKDFSHQTEEPQAEESKDFSYQPAVETADSFADTTNNYQDEVSKPESFDNYETQQTESFTAPVESFTPTPEQTYGSFEPQSEKQEEPVHSFEPVISPPVQSEPPKSRFSERNVDLPIEVSEDERRLHNDARRFARLLVSEIKLYNEQKVKEGRDSSDLYDRLREAIDRSREMYDKRVQPPVAAKFDYFHYEVVNTLAEGDTNKLGAGYPGSSI